MMNESVLRPIHKSHISQNLHLYEIEENPRKVYFIDIMKVICFCWKRLNQKT